MTLSKEPMVARLFKMPQSLSDALKEYAYKHDTSDADVVREALCAYIGMANPTVHGNAKYANDEERLAARRVRQKARRDLVREVLKFGH